ncbi:MAG: FkbM family methyltransferase [Actinomycetota bacterium]
MASRLFLFARRCWRILPTEFRARFPRPDWVSVQLGLAPQRVAPTPQRIAPPPEPIAVLPPPDPATLAAATTALAEEAAPAVERGAPVGETASPTAVEPMEPSAAEPRMPKWSWWQSNKRATVTLVVSPNEISFAHGTGVLLSRLIADRSDVVLLRSQTSYGGDQVPQALAAYVLPHGLRERSAVFGQVLDWLTPYQVESILCVPYFDTDLTLAVAAADITGAPLGLWIMDDNCLVTGQIDVGLMTEAIEKAASVFAISPELRKTYESRFRRKMWLLPPMVAPSLVRTDPSPPATGTTPVVVGNFWSGSWLDALRKITRATGIEVTWYASNDKLSWIDVSTHALARDGITVVEGLSNAEVLAAVLEAPCVIVPSDTGTGGAHEQALGDMSLPTRVPFVMAGAGTPLLVLGRRDTAVARFVERLGTGIVVPYEADAVASAIASLGEPERQAALRERAAELAPKFSFEGAWELVFQSIRNNGVSADPRFEALLPLAENEFAYYCEPPIPSHVFRDFREPYALCRRLVTAGWIPDVVLDVGASNGIWSYYMSEVFPNARFVLCDPLFSRYGQLYERPGFVREEVAVGAAPGTVEFEVSDNLYGSSLISTSQHTPSATVLQVPMVTLDEIVSRHELSGRALLKVDVQFAEHLVLEGGRETLQRLAEVVILELTVTRVPDGALDLLDMIKLMDDLGYRVFDQLGEWRHPSSGELEQVDLAFVRRSASFFDSDKAA